MDLTATDVMNTPIVGASPSAAAREIALYMLLGGFGGVPIAERDGRVAGIVTELDLLRAYRAGRSMDLTQASDIMTANVVSVEPKTPFEEVLAMIDSEQFNRVPVVDDKKLVGMISRPDLLRVAVSPQFQRFG